MRPLCDQAAAKRPQVRAAIYARVSTEAQEARGTIGSQLEALREHLAAEGHAPAASSSTTATPALASTARALTPCGTRPRPGWSTSCCASPPTA